MLKNIIRMFKFIKIYTNNTIKINFIYRWNIFVYVISGIFNVAAMLFIWYVVYQKTGKGIIEGYSFNSILIYTIMANLTRVLLDNEVEFIISEDIKSGNITSIFIRPIPYIITLVGEVVGSIIYNIIFLFVPIVSLIIISSFYFNISFGISYFSSLLYLLTVVFSAMIMFEISVLVGLCSFFVNYIWGFIMLEDAILSILTGELFPISFYPKIVVKILEFTPFYYINYAPVSILLNKFSTNDTIKVIFIQIIWCIILGILLRYFWKKSQTRLQVNGG